MNIPKVSIALLTKESKMPTYATDGSSGLDLYSNNTETLILKSKSQMLITTGVKIKLPEYHEGQIRSRSGLAAKNEIFVLNSPGTIDSDYRGEIKVILYNMSENDFMIEPSMKIAQMVITKYERVNLELGVVENDTERGSGGFGSTGLQYNSN